jgi:hypothetical protein
MLNKLNKTIAYRIELIWKTLSTKTFEFYFESIGVLIMLIFMRHNQPFYVFVHCYFCLGI